MRSTKWLWRINIFLMLVIIGSYIYLPKDKENDFFVSFLDVGQGDSIFIQAQNGKQLLIDGGRDNKVLGKLKEIMLKGDKSIDVVIGTHPDADHIGGLVDILKNYEIGAFFEPGSHSKSKIYKALEEEIYNKKIPHIFARAGTDIILDENTVFHIIFPDQDVSNWETNDSSVTGILESPYGKVLLTGDLPIEKELYLINKNGGQVLKSEILKLGHHGSRTSSSQKFLETVKPNITIISAGKNNSYGHPHKEVLDRLNFLKIPYMETSKDGTIKCFPKDMILVCE